MVLPLFNYCSVVWSSCSNGNSEKLVKLHNRLARLILSGDYRTSIAELHEALSWTALPLRCHYNRMCEVYKCVNKLNPNYLNSRFEIPSHAIGTRSLSNGSLCMSFVHKTNAGKRTFQYLGTLGWNKLRSTQRQYESLSKCKSSLLAEF